MELCLNWSIRVISCLETLSLPENTELIILQNLLASPSLSSSWLRNKCTHLISKAKNEFVLSPLIRAQTSGSYRNNHVVIYSSISLFNHNGRTLLEVWLSWAVYISHITYYFIHHLPCLFRRKNRPNHNPLGLVERMCCIYQLICCIFQLI